MREQHDPVPLPVVPVLRTDQGAHPADVVDQAASAQEERLGVVGPLAFGRTLGHKSAAPLGAEAGAHGEGGSAEVDRPGALSRLARKAGRGRAPSAGDRRRQAPGGGFFQGHVVLDEDVVEPDRDPWGGTLLHRPGDVEALPGPGRAGRVLARREAVEDGARGTGRRVLLERIEQLHLVASGQKDPARPALVVGDLRWLLGHQEVQVQVMVAEQLGGHEIPRARSDHQSAVLDAPARGPVPDA